MVRLLRSLVFEIKPRADLPLIESKVGSLTIQEENDSLLMISKIRELSESKSQQFKKRFDRGDRCFIALQDKHPASYLWIRGHGDSYYSALTKVKYPIASGTCWYLDVHTSVQFRGLGIVPWLYQESRKIMGYHFHYFVDVALDNLPSIRSMEKVGFTRVKVEKTLLVRNRIIRLS